MTTLIRIPGLVDVHVHLREPGATQKEDFTTGTQAAISGGYTQILDMPNNNPPTVDLESLRQKIQLAKTKIYCDVGFILGATDKSRIFFKKAQQKVFGIKLYMNKTTGPLLIKKSIERESIFRSAVPKLPIMIHALDDTLEAAIALAKKHNKKIHVCHITASQIRLLKKAKKVGIKITSEVTPHHLFLDKTNLKKLGPLGLMQPPLGSPKDRHQLWENLSEIDMISTDHAPHTRAEKFENSSPKFGVPGLETTLPLMLQAVDQKKTTLDQVIRLLCTSPRKIFRLPKQNETYIEVDTSKKFKISAQKLFTKCAWTPFSDLTGCGEIAKVVLRGKTVFANGHFTTAPQGKIIRPAI